MSQPCLRALSDVKGWVQDPLEGLQERGAEQKWSRQAGEEGVQDRLGLGEK